MVPNFNSLNYKHHHDKCIYILHVKMLNLLLIFAPYWLQDMVLFSMYKMVTRSLVYIYVACRYSLCYNNFYKQLSKYRLARKSNCGSETSIIKNWIWVSIQSVLIIRCHSSMERPILGLNPMLHQQLRKVLLRYCWM